MRRLVVMLIVLSTGSVVYAQVAGSVFPVPVPVSPVPVFGSSTSVIDHNGNLFVFDIPYSYPTPMTGQPMIQTRVTVIAADGTVKPPVQYAGAFQVVGAG